MTISQLYDLIGGDYADVIKRLPKPELTVRFIRKYAQSDEVDKMLLAYEQKDYALLFQTSHNLKGMLANLSLKSMLEKVSAICEAVRHGEPQTDISSMMKQVKLQQEQLLQYVAQLED